MARAAYGLVFLAAMIVPVVASAERYPGWGDTGWVYASRRDCCNAAIAIANDYSARGCVDAGSVPNPMRGGAKRGTCNVQRMSDGAGGVLYRCYGEAAIWCR